MRSLKQDVTTTTASSSSFLSEKRANMRPHDAYHFQTEDWLSTNDDDEVIVLRVCDDGSHYDPDRLKEILVMNHESELGEI
jgi:hypothetical protein